MKNVVVNDVIAESQIHVAPESILIMEMTRNESLRTKSLCARVNTKGKERKNKCHPTRMYTVARIARLRRMQMFFPLLRNFFCDFYIELPGASVLIIV